MRLCILIILLVFSHCLYCQQNDVYPDLFATYFYNPGLVNPAYIHPESKADFFTYYKQRTGPFEKIASYSFSVSKAFMREGKTSHLVRGIFNNEKEGPYIGRPRGYANYALSVPLSDNTRIAAGTALGFVQVAYSAPSATATGSFITPDGAVGLLLQSKNLETGFSAMQVLNSFSSPLNAPIHVRRYYNFYGAATKEFSPYWRLKANLLWQVYAKVPDAVNLNVYLSYHDRISFGAGFANKTGLNFFITMNVPVGKDRILIAFAYSTPFRTATSLPVSSLQFNGSYSIR